MEVLSERGYDGVSYEEVARRCGASKASLYRRWNSKRDMVIAAVRSGPARHELAEPIDTGSLREDLLCLCRRLNRTMRAADSQAALLLLQAGVEDPELCDAIESSVGPTGARLPQGVLNAAIARGELPKEVDPFPFEEVVGAALLLRRVNGLAADEEYLAALIDAIVLPALRATATSGSPLPAGIFSGHPSHHVQEQRQPRPEENP
jgi:AcrR family transcriptional regulator